MAEIRTFQASDGYQFYYRRYAPQRVPRGRVVFVHGIRSHGGWYGRSCEEIAAAGYEVLFLDRRGAGLNTAHRADCPSFRRLLDDVAEFLRDLRTTQPCLPITLAGISWGGKIVTGLTYRAPGLIDAAVLLCPGLCPQVRPPFIERAKILRAKFRDPTQLFAIPLNEPELFTTSREWQQFIAADRFGLHRATARFLYSSVSFDIYLKRAVKRLTEPTLLMLGSEDRIIDNAATRKMFVRFASRRKTIIDYEGSHHTLEFEDAGHPFVRDMLEWLSRSIRL